MKYLSPFILSGFLVLVCLPVIEEAYANKYSSGENSAYTGKVMTYGIYDVVRTGALVNNPDTNTGKAHSASTILLSERTDRIPLKKGNYFGFQSRIDSVTDKSFIKLRKVVKHPAMTKPDGSVFTGYEVNETKRVASGVALAISGYSFDEDYEMVAGNWVFQFWHEDKLLVEQRFTTYWQK